MKVLFIFYLPSGGVETLNRLRCRALNQAGIEAHVLYFNSGSTPGYHTELPVCISNDDAVIKSLLEAQRYDAIVVTSDFITLQRLRSLGYTGILLYESQGLGVRSEAEKIIREAVPYLQLYCNAALLPPTEHLMELFINVCPWLHRYVISNIVDSDTFRYTPGAKPVDPVLGWVGRLEPNKNWAEYLEIAAIVRRSKPNLHLWMFHDPTLARDPYKQQFDDKVDALGLRDRLIEYSNIPNTVMPSYYSAIADSGGLLLSTSMMEGFGYAVAEALLCTCPVLSTDSDGVRSFIRHNETGKFYPLGHAEQGAAEALALMDDLALRDTIRTQGRQHMSTSFAPQRYAQSFREMMNSFGIF